MTTCARKLEHLVIFCSFGFLKNHLHFKVWINLSSKRSGRRRILTKQFINTLERHNYQCYKLFQFPHNPACFLHNQCIFPHNIPENSRMGFDFFHILSDGLYSPISAVIVAVVSNNICLVLSQ